MGLDFMSFTGLLKFMACCQIEEASLRAMSLVSQVLASYGLMGLNTEQPDKGTRRRSSEMEKCADTADISVLFFLWLC